MVTVVSWPSEVPQTIMPTSANGGPRDNRYSFETDSVVAPIERPSTTWAPDVFAVELAPMTLAQFAAFDAWFRGALKFGAFAFTFPHPITGDSKVWKIAKADPPYQVRKLIKLPVGSTRRGVSVSFSIMSLPQ